jgi:LysR family transcriptional activator of nhaA
MEWLNYHHLLYFWTAAREGSIARATAELRLAQPTVSGQIRRLEESLGEKLFRREGRRLVLTDVGRLVYGYADEIFGLGRELQDALKGKRAGRPLTLAVGIADVLPKLVAHRLLEPAERAAADVRLVCQEDKPEKLLAALALHELDVVLSDSPAPSSVRVRAFSHLLGECGLVMMATASLAAAHRKGFPGSLDGAPLLLPTENTTLRRSLEQWFLARGIRPRIVGEFEDSALLKVFGQAGRGIFPAPDVVAGEVQRQYQVKPVGPVPDVRERFYALTVQRRLEHPAVIAIIDRARRELFR